MADKEETKAPDATPAQDKPKAETVPDVGQLTEGKFKSIDELAKAYKEAQSKIGEQGKELGEAREFTETVRPLLELVRDDPELFKVLDEKLRAAPADKAKAETKDEEKGADQDEIRQTASDIILARFEEKNGIDKLPPDERLKFRREIGNVINELTGRPLGGVDLRRLQSVLENSLIIARERVDKSTLEALSSAKEVSEAAKADKAPASEKPATETPKAEAAPATVAPARLQARGRSLLLQVLSGAVPRHRLPVYGVRFPGVGDFV